MKTALCVGVSLCVAASAAAEPRRLVELPFEPKSVQITVDETRFARVTAWADEHPDGTVVLGGHGGADPESVRLALARAQAVRDALVDRGVNPDQIVISTFARPLAQASVVVWGAADSR